jgi:membrane associated rhomboid family serine protease
MHDLLNLMILLQKTIQNSLDFFIILSVLLFSIVIIFRLAQPYSAFLGIIPRKWYGLPGIIFSPFTHANLNHLFFNLIPLFILSAFLLAWGFNFYWNLSWLLILISGFLIWCFARPGIHVGASALITAYWGFLVAEALIGGGSIYNYFVAFICIYYFIGIFFGIFPNEEQVSWEGHLIGLISGVGLFLACFYIPLCHQWVFQAPYLISFPWA